MFARTRMVLEPETREAVLAAYHGTKDAETRTRLQMILLANDQQWSPAQIAPVVQRSHDVVLRVLQRFAAGGVEAVPRRYGSGRPRRITAAWEAELQRVIERDPHEVGVESSLWTTGLLADYLAQETGVTVSPEAVRTHLHRLGYVCKRPTWTVQHKAQEREDWEGNACGWRSC